MIAIKVSDLRVVAEEVLDHIATEFGDSIVLEHDYFWSIPGAEVFDVTRQPLSLTVGQVSESLEFLQSTDPKQRLAYELVWLADVVRAVGVQVAR